MQFRFFFSVTELPMQDDIVAKLLDFIAEPRAKDDSALSDDQVKSVATMDMHFLRFLMDYNNNEQTVALVFLTYISMFYTSVLGRDQILGNANERWGVQLKIQKAHTRDLGR